MERLFSVIVFVFNADGSKSLFVNHRKLHKWLPPGGKVDRNEIPDETARRECLEETGVVVTLVGERFPFESSLIRPFGMQLNTIVPGEREHIDFIYMALADEKAPLVVSEGEVSDVRWIPCAEIIANNFNTFPEVAYWIERLALQLKR